ncbi:MAG: DOMON domain-containing protein [Actinomycetota bacterium]|nr:DOMON domain-containing protein [Actinomycetota bacterium]
MKRIIPIFLLWAILVLILSGCTEQAPQTQSTEIEKYSIQDINIDGNISEDEYRYSLDDNATGLTVYWSNDDSNVYLAIRYQEPGWVALGFNPSFAMKDANIIMMAFQDGQAIVRDDYGTGNFTHQPDEQLGGTTDIVEYAATGESFELAIPLDSQDQYDQELQQGNSYKLILATGSSYDFDTKHSKRSTATISLD